MEQDEELLGMQRNAAGPLCRAHPTAGHANGTAREGRNLLLPGQKPLFFSREVSVRAVGSLTSKMECAGDLNITEWLIKIMELLLSVWLQLNFPWVKMSDLFFLLSN